MSDETKENEEPREERGERVEDRIGHGELLSELTTLGQRFGQAVQTAWESEQRKSIQSKVLEELKTAGDHVDRIARRSGAAKPAQELQEGAEKISRQLGDGLLAGLKALNRELSRTIEKRERHKDDDEPGD